MTTIQVYLFEEANHGQYVVGFARRPSSSGQPEVPKLIDKLVET